jgi:hypothetical protein
MAHSVYSVLATFPVRDEAGEVTGERKSRLMDFDSRNEAEQYRDDLTEEAVVEGASFEVRLLDRRG